MPGFDQAGRAGLVAWVSLDGHPGSAYTGRNRRPRRPAQSGAGRRGLFPLIVRIALLPCLFLLATACSLVRAAPQASAASQASPTELAPTVGPTATPSPFPTATTPACLSQPGKILADEYTDPSLPRSIPHRVYLPPCYEPDGDSPYPVLLLLHGLQLTDAQWEDLGVDDTADELIRQGVIPPLVIVMPWERKGLEFETALVDHLLPHIRTVYAGGGDRSTTAIGGISRGAGWALRIGLKHPDTFGAVGLHSPAVLVPDLFWLPDWIEAAGANVPSLWIDIAERDTSRAGATELGALLDELGVPFEWSTAPGEHSATYWSSRLREYLAWYGDNLSAGG